MSTNLDALRIAVLGYGSLMRQVHAPFSKIPLCTTSTWALTPFKLPIDYLQLAFANTRKAKLALVIHEDSPLRPVWYTFSCYGSLAHARANLAAREETQILEHIPFIIRDHHSTDKYICSFKYKGWKGNLAKLPEKYIYEIVQWAQDNNIDAVIWASFTANITKTQAKELLISNPIILKNTQEYIKKVPMETPNEFEHAVLSNTLEKIP